MSGVIVGAVVGAVMGAISGISGIKGANKSRIEAYKQQVKAISLQYNYNQNQLTRQEKSIYDNAVSDLFQLQLQSLSNNGMVESALAESGYEGRGSEKVKQSLDAAVGRQKTSIKADAEARVTNVRAQKDALYISTKSQMENLRDSTNAQLIGGSQAFFQVLDSTAKGAAMGAAGGALVGAVAGGVGGAAGGSAGGSAAGSASGAASGATTSTLSSVAGNSVVQGTSTASVGTSFLSRMGSTFNTTMSNYNTIRANNQGLFSALDMAQRTTSGLSGNTPLYGVSYYENQYGYNKRKITY